MKRTGKWPLTRHMAAIPGMTLVLGLFCYIGVAAQASDVGCHEQFAALKQLKEEREAKGIYRLEDLVRLRDMGEAMAGCTFEQARQTELALTMADTYSWLAHSGDLFQQSPDDFRELSLGYMRKFNQQMQKLFEQQPDDLAVARRYIDSLGSSLEFYPEGSFVSSSAKQEKLKLLRSYRAKYKNNEWFMVQLALELTNSRATEADIRESTDIKVEWISRLRDPIRAFRMLPFTASEFTRKRCWLKDASVVQSAIALLSENVSDGGEYIEVQEEEFQRRMDVDSFLDISKLEGFEREEERKALRTRLSESLPSVLKALRDFECKKQL
ncbi:hypothetical protein HPT27_03440 [Permianibacter sp. IMCC34836]|uniref:hypothetical protein n=1 Tax=Permianibacter fluminis TaxID=2738515 RepID=UPI001556AD0B|nr:hypothetical protein [Permianibacter fluminis]NQD36063.1 hypothetical protein [Permianibacter fluminis]